MPINGSTLPAILPIELATFTFAPDEPHAGQEGVVVAYVVRHSEGALLFDTGFGFGSPEVDARYHPIALRLPDALAGAGIATGEIDAVVNCHLHIDHAGQNSELPGVPIHVQAREWQVAHTTEHTILEWIDFLGADYRQHDGDYELAAGVRVLSTPGHTPGHQSLVVESPDGVVLLAGQAVYGVDEWSGLPGSREGLSRASDRDAYAASFDLLRSLDPVRVYFAHDRGIWTRGSATGAGGV